MTASDFQTLLVISQMGIPLYSARGLTQTLTPIDAAADMARTVNGTMLDLSDQASFRKYRSEISCNDMSSPAFDGFWPGMEVTVDCVVELCYLTSTAGTGGGSRTAVQNSEYTVGDFTCYRPQLDMTIISYSIATDEWNAATNWTLVLEER